MKKPKWQLSVCDSSIELDFLGPTFRQDSTVVTSRYMHYSSMLFFPFDKFCDKAEKSKKVTKSFKVTWPKLYFQTSKSNLF